MEIKKQQQQQQKTPKLPGIILICSGLDLKADKTKSEIE